MQRTPMTPAHTQTERLTLAYNFPAHEPRADDPHYAVFNATRARMKRLGLLVCWICGAEHTTHAPIELHHSVIEFALLNAVSWERVAADHADWHLKGDDDLANEINSEAGLTALCVAHHRGLTGIHTIHYPAWLTQRYLRDPAFVPEEAVRGGAP